MSDSDDQGFLDLQRRYLAAFPGLLADLGQCIVASRTGSDDAVSQLKTRFHQLAGSGGAYGFPEISALAREAEQSISARPAGLDADHLDRVVAELDAVYRRARAGQ